MKTIYAFDYSNALEKYNLLLENFKEIQSTTPVNYDLVDTLKLMEIETMDDENGVMKE
jgi:hypothetical protein